MVSDYCIIKPVSLVYVDFNGGKAKTSKIIKVVSRQHYYMTCALSYITASLNAVFISHNNSGQFFPLNVSNTLWCCVSGWVDKQTYFESKSRIACCEHIHIHHIPWIGKASNVWTHAWSIKRHGQADRPEIKAGIKLSMPVPPPCSITSLQDSITHFKANQVIPAWNMIKQKCKWADRVPNWPR